MLVLCGWENHLGESGAYIVKSTSKGNLLYDFEDKITEECKKWNKEHFTSSIKVARKRDGEDSIMWTKPKDAYLKWYLPEYPLDF